MNVKQHSFDLAANGPKQPPARRPFPSVKADDNRAARYAKGGLKRECDEIAAEPEGSRNEKLNRGSWAVGGYVAAGHLDYDETEAALIGAGLASGLPLTEVTTTVRRALADSDKAPREVVVAVDTADYAKPAHVLMDDDATTALVPQSVDQWVIDNLPALDWHALWADDSEQEWIVEPILPVGRLVALYSPPKVGKSLLMLEIAAAVATGRDVLGNPTTAAIVLYVDFENDPRGDIRDRLQSMGYTPDQLDNLIVLSFPTLAALDSDRGGQELLAAVTYYRAALVIIDTVSRAVEGEENANDTWLNFYRHTGLRLKQAGVAGIRLDHTGKDETKGQRGGSAKVGDVDAIWKLAMVDEDQLTLTCEASRMQVDQKILTLTRRDTPLHHQVDKSGYAGLFDKKVAEIVAALDALNIPTDCTTREAKDALRASGVKGRDSPIIAAVKRRKASISPFYVAHPELAI